MKLCIAEKPSVAGEIAKVLGASVRDNGFFSGNGYCVTWVFGHLCELKEPHDYDPVLRKWDMALLPIIPQKFGVKLKEDSGVKKQFAIISRLISQAEEVINCGDAGQEGELIQRWVMQLAKIKCPVKRLWISSLTEESIRDGFAHLKDGAEFDSLFAAGSARAIGDWLLGMNATRAYTLRYGSYGMTLSIGRVQTPTLALIVARHLEISNFKPETYWELKTTYRDVAFSAVSGKFNSVDDANAELAKIDGKPFVVKDVSAKKGKESAPALFDLTSLQVECNNKFAMSAEETLRIAQSLYENKYTTYPRVDTKFLTDDIYPKVPTILKGLLPYQQLTVPLLAMPKLPKSKRVFNNLKVTDHHAIIPTGVTPSPAMPRQEKLVFDLIARRFIANFYPDSEVLLTTVLGDVEGVQFKVNGKQIVVPGWREVYGSQKIDADSSKDDNRVLPVFVVGESGPHSPALQEKQTTPPKPYTEATLLRAMETAGKQVDDEELRDLMKENGIGRPSTRAAIIETLIRRKYIAKERKNLVPTVNGIRLVEVIKTPILKSVEMTGIWEKKLRQIERCEFTTPKFIEEMKELVFEVLNSVVADVLTKRFEAVIEPKKKKDGDASSESTTPSKSASKCKAAPKDMVCPRCGKPIVKGKAAWGCSGFREGCRVVVPFSVFGKNLSESQAASLFAKGETSVIKGIDVDGAKRDGKLVLDSNYAVSFRSVEEKKFSIEDLVCPLCSGRIVEGRAAWGCSNYSKGCRFIVPYVFMGKKLTQTHLSVLARKKRTSSISGFVDENGIARSGALVVTDSGAIVLEEKR